ncbi:MAG: YHYH protein [Verrucomicrobia bacterium]|nr:YHYH protein [Verrucomicrobiota bacterium]
MPFILACLLLSSNAFAALVSNPTLNPALTKPNIPAGFQITGNATYGELGDAMREYSGVGVKFRSSKNDTNITAPQGQLSTLVTNLTALSHRWFRLRIRAMAQANFSVEQDDLFLEVEFFGRSTEDALDKIKRRIYPQVRQERADLTDPGTSTALGIATWRTYEMEFRTPFSQVDILRLNAGFNLGNAKAADSEFWISEFHLEPIAAAGHFRSRQTRVSKATLQSLVPLGGRWYYDPSHLSRAVPKRFDHTNVNRLLYLTDKLEAPFVDNTSAWLKDGFYDLRGKVVKTSRFVPDNVMITFSKEHLIVHSKNLPNHPTAFFPDIWRALDGNPNHIQEMQSTWYLPLAPAPNPNGIAMTTGNQNNALPGGPIGVAVNGVVFFNPYDLERNEDAIWRLDRCCGHPSPNSQYHYHKYPVCVKSPWSDDGEQHSPMIGFAFDGFPIYGPYEAKNLLAKNASSNPLNDFNVHFDSQRGWHYHVTPGEFPHLIGGYWGTLDPNNRRTRGPRNGRGRSNRQGPRR